MRLRDLMAVTLSGLVTWQLVWMSQSRIENIIPFAQQVNRTDATRNNAVGLDSQIWSTFQIPERSVAIRLLTNAAVRNPRMPVVTQADPRAGWRYAIEYQLTDLKGNILDESEYHFRSRVEPMIDIATGHPVYPMFFEDSSIATQTRVMQIGLSPFEKRRPAMIRVRFKSSDPNIKGVAARVLSQLERLDADQRSTWNRLSRQRRDEICKYCVYDSDLLGFDERASLLRWHWINSPTVGEFDSQPLYSRSDLDEEAIEQPLLPAGKYTAENWISSFPVPSGIGNVRLQFISVQDQPLDDITAQIHWFGQHPQERFAAVADSSNFVLDDLDGGLIQVRPDVECVIRAFWRPADKADSETARKWMSERQPNEWGEFEITPEPAKVRAFLVNDSEVDFEVSHLSEQSTPFQISVRQIFDNEFFAQTGTDYQAARILNWLFLNEADQVVDSGKIAITNEVTKFDHLQIAGNRILLSDAHSAYFSIPNNVKKVRFGSQDGPLLVNGSVRPSGLPRNTRVPEDYLPFEKRERRTRSWYAINPIDHESLFQNNRSFIINTQLIAPEIDPRILMGQYDWQRFEPNGNWIGREILIPIEVLPERQESLQSVYYEIGPSRSWQISKHEMLTAPRRVSFIVAANQAPGTVTIKLGNKVAYRKRHVSKRGLIELPMPSFASTTDKMKMTVETDNPCRLFVAGIHVHDTAKFVKRLTHRFHHSKLDFDYAKRTREKELITMKLLRGQTANPERCRIRVHIEPHKPLIRSGQPIDGWTLLNRVYDLTPGRTRESLVMDKDDQVDDGCRCLITLDTDLPPGNYKVNVECLDNEHDAYVLLYRTIPGKTPKHRIHSIPDMIRPVTELVSAPEHKVFQPERFSSDRNSGDKNNWLAVKDWHPQIEERELLDDALRQLLKANKDSHYPGRAGREELIRIEGLFTETASAHTVNEELVARWKSLGWNVEELPNHGIVVIKENKDQLHGRGMYAIRPRSESNTIIQAPHRFYDKKTGVISRKLFVENDIFAAAWNSSHRKQIDIAHEQQHHFNAFMNALTNPGTKIVQLHGFDSESRSGKVKSTDIILSDSTRFPARHAMQAAVRLKELLGKQVVRLFPIEVEELGGTKNSQATLLRSAGFHRFLHIELDADYRQQLVESASKRAEFATALLNWGENPEERPKP